MVIVTDDPPDFQDCPNVIAVKLHRTSIQYPYNDKRFALAEGLKHYECAVFIDADTAIDRPLPKTLTIKPGMTAASVENLERDLIRHHPDNLPKFRKFAKKIGVDLSQAQWIAENLIMVRKDQGREQIFLETWAYADRWLGLRRAWQSDHGYIGVSAAKAGWKVFPDEEFLAFKDCLTHQGHHSIGVEGKTWGKKSLLLRRIGFHWRRLKAFAVSLTAIPDYWG